MITQLLSRYSSSLVGYCVCINENQVKDAYTTIPIAITLAQLFDNFLVTLIGITLKRFSRPLRIYA